MPHPAALDADHWPRAGDDELARLVARNDQLEAENAGLRAQGEHQRKRIAALERKVEELRRKAKRQAAPFSREKPKRDPGRPGRKPGADYGKRAHRPAPEEGELAFRPQCGQLIPRRVRPANSIQPALCRSPEMPRPPCGGPAPC